jgi:hypothetical protein
VFVRANSAGLTLEYSDLLLATATAKWETLDARKEIQDFTSLGDHPKAAIDYHFKTGHTETA